MIVKNLLTVISATVALLLLCGPAWAGTTTTTFAVSATVINNCTVSATPLAYGNYDPTSASNTTGTNTITVTCTDADAYTIALNGGTTSGGTISQRKMTNGASNTLNYNIYQDSGHITLWGDGTTGTTENGTGSGAAQNYTAYGEITHAQTAPAGSYTDTITTTISF